MAVAVVGCGGTGGSPEPVTDSDPPSAIATTVPSTKAADDDRNDDGEATASDMLYPDVVAYYSRHCFGNPIFMSFVPQAGVLFTEAQPDALRSILCKRAVRRQRLCNTSER